MWRHWLDRLGERHTVVRYDERGCGLSDANVGDPSLETWVGDLEAVVDAVRPGAIRVTRHLPGRRGRRRVCGATSGPRLRPRSLRRVCAWATIPRRGRRGGRAPRRDPRGLDGAESGVPPGVQHALCPARHTRANGLVRGSAQGHHVSRRRNTSVPGARRPQRLGARAAGPCPDPGHARAGRPSGAGRRGPGARRADSGRRLRAPRLGESHPAGARAGLGCVPLRARRISGHGLRAPPADSQSWISARESSRCWSSWRRA